MSVQWEVSPWWGMDWPLGVGTRVHTPPGCPSSTQSRACPALSQPYPPAGPPPPHMPPGWPPSPRISPAGPPPPHMAFSVARSLWMASRSNSMHLRMRSAGRSHQGRISHQKGTHHALPALPVAVEQSGRATSPWLTGSAPSPMHQQRTVLLSWVLPAWAGTSHRPPLSCHHLSQQAVPPSSCPPLCPRTPQRRSDHGRASCKRDGGQGSGRPDRFPNFGFSILEHLDRFSHSAMIHRLKDHPYARKKQTCDAEGAVGRVPRALRQTQQLPTCPGLREASIARCRQLSGLCLAGRGRAGFAQGPDV